MTIGILGGGVWGSALAKLFSDQEVLIYTRDKKVMNSINDHHFNPKLKYVIFNISNHSIRKDVFLKNLNNYLNLNQTSDSKH